MESNKPNEAGAGTRRTSTEAASGGVSRAAEPGGSRRRLRDRLLLQEDLNFLLTNRIPRALLTRAMGRLSRVRSPWLTRGLLTAWRLFTDLDLSESRLQRFESLRDCFTRELKPGARPIDADPSILVSPCDGIVGAFGEVRGTEAFQAKGFPYSIRDLFGTAEAAEAFQDGLFVTLRLTSSMYHRFHSPDTATLDHVTSISGDTWNVNPIALRRIEALFCRNERAVVRLRLEDGTPVALVAWRPSSWPRSACTASTWCCTRVAAGHAYSTWAVRWPGERNWDGSSTVPPSFCSRPMASRSTRACRWATGSEWVSRLSKRPVFRAPSPDDHRAVTPIFGSRQTSGTSPKFQIQALSPPCHGGVTGWSEESAHPDAAWVG